MEKKNKTSRKIPGTHHALERKISHWGGATENEVKSSLFQATLLGKYFSKQHCLDNIFPSDLAPENIFPSHLACVMWCCYNASEILFVRVSTWKFSRFLCVFEKKTIFK